MASCDPYPSIKYFFLACSSLDLNKSKMWYITYITGKKHTSLPDIQFYPTIVYLFAIFLLVFSIVNYGLDKRCLLLWWALFFLSLNKILYVKRKNKSKARVLLSWWRNKTPAHQFSDTGQPSGIWQTWQTASQDLISITLYLVLWFTGVIPVCSSDHADQKSCTDNGKKHDMLFLFLVLVDND